MTAKHFHATPPAPGSGAVTLTFCGDTSLGYSYLHGRKRRATVYERLLVNPGSFFDGVGHLVRDSDHLVMNFEAVLSDAPLEPLEGKEYPGIDDPAATVATLKALGVTAVNMANNHAMDFSDPGLRRSLDTFAQAGIASFGAGLDAARAARPLEIDVPTAAGPKKVFVFAGLRAGPKYRREFRFFADTDKPGVAALDPVGFRAAVAALRAAHPDALVIACPHWQGRDYQDISDRIRAYCRGLVDDGADLVLAHGTHKMDAVEFHEGGLIAYSIGNFVFNSPGRYRSLQALPYSLVARIELRCDADGWQIAPRFYPINTDNKRTDYRVRPVTPEEFAVVAEKFPALAPAEDARGAHLRVATRPELPGDPLGVWQRVLHAPRNEYPGMRNYDPLGLVRSAFEARGCSVDHFGQLLRVSLDGRSCFFNRFNDTSYTSLLAYKMSKNKIVARKLMAEAGLSVADGGDYATNQKEAARAKVEKLGDAVLKPSNGRKGLGVVVGVTAESFDSAWEDCVKHCSQRVLVERAFRGGIEARYFVIDGVCVAVAQRIPPFVLGDGQSSIRALVAARNAQRARNPNLAGRPIRLDASRERALLAQGHRPDDILPEGAFVIIDWKANLSTGADSVDITDLVSPEMKTVAGQAVQAVPGLHLAGVDIMAHDHSARPAPGNHIIIEINTGPGIGGHQYPAYGTPRDIATLIAGSCIRRMQKGI